MDIKTRLQQSNSNPANAVKKKESEIPEKKAERQESFEVVYEDGETPAKYLFKTNILLNILMGVSILLLLAGFIWTVIAIIPCFTTNKELTFSLISTPIIMMLVGFVCLIPTIFAKNIVDKKRRLRYRSRISGIKKVTPERQSKYGTESAKQGESSSYGKLKVEQEESVLKRCPHCTKVLYDTANPYCPYCNKRVKN